MKRALSILLLLLSIPVMAQTPKQPRIRIVPQTSDGVMQLIEESADGTRLITHDREYAPRLWDAQRQILLTILGGHKDQIQKTAFSPDGKYIYTLSNSELRLWDSSRAKLLGRWSPGNGEHIEFARFSPATNLLALGLNTTTQVLSVPDLKEVATFTGADAIRNVEFSPDASIVATAGKGKVWLYNLATKKPSHVLTMPEPDKYSGGAIRWLEFSRDGKMLLSTGMFTSRAYLHDVATGRLLEQHPHHFGSRSVPTEQMGSLWVGTQGDNFITYEANGEMVVRKPGQKEKVFSFTSHKDTLREIRRSRSHRFLSTYSDDMTLRMWDVDNRKELPFKPEEGSPTAADFSPKDENVFWLGYARGELRKYDVATGKATTTTLGDVAPLQYAQLHGSNDPYLWLYSPYIDDGSKRRNGLQVALDPEGNVGPHWLQNNFTDYEFSPDGRYVAMLRLGFEGNLQVIELKTNRLIWTLKDPKHFLWSPDSKSLAVFWETSMAAYSVPEGTTLKTWSFTFDKDDLPMQDSVFHPNGKWLVAGGSKGGKVYTWDLETAATVKEYLGLEGRDQKFYFTPDGKRLVGYSYSEYTIWDAETAAVLGKGKLTMFPELTTSPDGNYLLFSDYDGHYLVSSQTGKEIMRGEAQRPPAAFTSDSKRLALADRNLMKIVDPLTGKTISEIAREGLVKDVQFVSGDSKLLIADDVLGMAIYDAKKLDKLATLVMMNDEKWLVYDEQGRYDASDPGNVTGAYFVLEWEGGLEAIGMPQLKSQFYEPGLLGKVLGYNKEPLRDVPNLETLRLFPALEVKTGSKAGVIDITAKERDNGGIGRVNVFLNGKQVYSKKSAPYIQFDLKEYEAFMLPDTLLQGNGNMLSVTVSNEKGDLTSTPVSMDVGVPQGLRAPDVKLYALCVGVGDYVGSGADLIAPPADARELGKALSEVSQKLLPNRAEISVLDTAAADTTKRPTRANIMSWFGELKKKATSSDVVMVFFAGHGVSKIGDKAGYFFLTSEADPSDVNPASAATSTISGDDLRTALSEVAANKQVVILDTCHSGAASESLIESDRSVSGEYQRAWEAIKDTTGTWLLAGSAADQKSYESTNVEHGMLTYSLLEAIDRASPEGLRQTPSGELFVDVEKWLNYAANRVESLKVEAGVKGIQRPEFKRSTKGSTFDIGVTTPDKRGFLGLKAPRPIVIVGGFQMDEEDPAGLETAVGKAMADSRVVKPWFDIAKHPNVYRMAGSYTEEGGKLKVKLFLQKFDADQTRKTLETIEIEEPKSALVTLANRIKEEIEKRVKALEEARLKPTALG